MASLNITFKVYVSIEKVQEMIDEISTLRNLMGMDEYEPNLEKGDFSLVHQCKNKKPIEVSTNDRLN